MNNFTIYMHKNKINNKVYIGQTCQEVERRWKNGSGYASQPYFYNAIQKYGWDKFDHIILEENLTQEQANEREKYYIELYKATNSDYGYNCLSGGSNLTGKNNPMYGKHHSEETRKKMSEIASNRSEETHKKMSESAKRRVERDGVPFKGKHHSEETKEKLRQTDRSYMQTEEYRQNMSKAVSGGNNSNAKKLKATNLETGEEIIFNYQMEALQFLNLSRSSSKFLNKAIINGTSYHGYIWKELKDE